MVMGFYKPVKSQQAIPNCNRCKHFVKVKVNTTDERPNECNLFKRKVIVNGKDTYINFTSDYCRQNTFLCGMYGNLFENEETSFYGYGE